MTNELEFSISQYLDGTLPPLEAARVEELLAGSAEARAIYAEFEKLNGVLRSSAAPAVDWGKLSAGISEQIVREDAPAVTYKLTHFIRIAAVAAVIAVVGVVAVLLSRQPPRPGESNIAIATQTPTGTAEIEIVGPGIGATAAVASIEIGPAKGQDPQGIHLADAVISRPTRVIIASGAKSAQDSSELPY